MEMEREFALFEASMGGSLQEFQTGSDGDLLQEHAGRQRRQSQQSGQLDDLMGKEPGGGGSGSEGVMGSGDAAADMIVRIEGMGMGGQFCGSMEDEEAAAGAMLCADEDRGYSGSSSSSSSGSSSGSGSDSDIEGGVRRGTRPRNMCSWELPEGMVSGAGSAQQLMGNAAAKSLQQRKQRAASAGCEALEASGTRRLPARH
jgi:hypothetical protein